MRSSEDHWPYPPAALSERMAADTNRVRVGMPSLRSLTHTCTSNSATPRALSRGETILLHDSLVLAVTRLASRKELLRSDGRHRSDDPIVAVPHRSLLPPDVRTCTLQCAGLFIFNGVDLVAGFALCVYSLYIGTNHFAPLWLYVPLLVISSILIGASLMSSFGLVFRSCSGCMALSSDVLVWVSLAELGLAVVIFTQGGSIDNFLREHSNELKLSGDQLTQFERHKFYPAYALLALCFMEALRQRYSTKLHHARLRRQYQYEMLA